MEYPLITGNHLSILRSCQVFFVEVATDVEALRYVAVGEIDGIDLRVV